MSIDDHTPYSEAIRSHRLELYVHRIMVITLKRGPDYVALETNLPDPMGNGTMALNLQCPRDTGEIYAKTHFPGVEVVSYHYGIGGATPVFDEQSARQIARAHEQQHPHFAKSV